MSVDLKSSISSLLKLSLPIIMGQLGQMLIVAGDVFVATKYSTEAVAAIGVANGFINPLFLFGIGMTMGVSPSFAYFRGKGEDIKDNAMSVLVYSLVLGLLISISMLFLNRFIPYFGIDPKIVPGIQAYIDIVSWSLPFALIFGGLKEFLQSYEEVFIPNLISILAVGLNIAVNYLFVFGYESWNGMGQIGLAWASLSVRILLGIVIIFYTFSKFPIGKIKFNVIKVLAKFSLPIAFMFFLEVTAFCTVTILSGRLGVVPAATNNIIMTIASISFMIPLSLSSAAAVKVGHSFGANNIKDVFGHTKAIILCTFAFSLFSILVFGVFPNTIMHFMTQDNAVIELGIKLLVIVALFQVFDAFQVTLAGVLRGLGETKFPSLMVFLGYWIIGIPSGIYLTFWKGQGASGLWIGLALSLAIVAVSLGLFSYKKFKTLV